VEGGPGFTREQIGKIQVTEFCTFVGVVRNQAQSACDKLQVARIKGKTVKARLL
jgi:ATP-independent RNA helicase DbpA